MAPVQFFKEEGMSQSLPILRILLVSLGVYFEASMSDNPSPT